MGELSAGPLVATDPAGLPAWMLVAGMAAGCAVLLAGLWLIRRGRGAMHTPPTRLTVGVCMLLSGYHLLTWSAPFGATMLRIPPERWWVLVGIVVLSLAGAGVGELIEHRQDLKPG
jgi:hypothetical protein